MNSYDASIEVSPSIRSFILIKSAREGFPLAADGEEALEGEHSAPETVIWTEEIPSHIWNEGIKYKKNIDLIENNFHWNIKKALLLGKRRDEGLRLKATTLELADIEEVEAEPFGKKKTIHIVARYLD